MNTKRKGSLAIGEAITHFINNGLTVLLPVADCDKYDLAVDEVNSIKRVQCKYTNDKEPSGAYIVDLRTFGGYRGKTYTTKYLKEDFDYLFILCGDKNTYLIPTEKISDRSQLIVGVKKWNEYKC